MILLKKQDVPIRMAFTILAPMKDGGVSVPIMIRPHLPCKQYDDGGMSLVVRHIPMPKNCLSLQTAVGVMVVVSDCGSWSCKGLQMKSAFPFGFVIILQEPANGTRLNTD